MNPPPFALVPASRRAGAILAWIAAASAWVGPGAQGEAPPARALSRELSSQPRLAGTVGSEQGARRVAAWLEEAGFAVELDRRRVMLSLPRQVQVAGRLAEDGEALFERLDRFDPDAEDPGDVPLFSAWSASASVDGPVVDAGRGLRADFARLLREGVELRGRIALARYGGSYRGVKAALAEEYGCAGLLLFSDPEEDGAARGPVWPTGRWKPGWAAQRGSISQLAEAPGDPSTPGWPSPAPEAEAHERRLDRAAMDARLPGIPCTPIGADEATQLTEVLASGGTPWVLLTVDAPREVRTVTNVIGRLAGTGPELVVAGNHRDAWVRGAQDAGSGTVALVRAAQHLGARQARGWQPRATIVLAFWDAEESGLIGSTEWGEAHAADLAARCVAYVNGDAVVSGTTFRASGTPGLETSLRAALARVSAADGPEGARPSLEEQWMAIFDGPPRLGLPGSGSDFTVFLHHLGLPVLDIGFGGNPGGQYHTSFDDFEFMDRFLDPDWSGHETAGRFLAELLAELAERERGGFDPAAAARAMAHHARAAGEEEHDGRAWLGTERAALLTTAFERLARATETHQRPPRLPGLYRALLDPVGLADRPWYRNRLWAPGLETGYAAETFPGLRLAARRGEDALDDELAVLVTAVDALRRRWESTPTLAPPPPTAGR